MNISVFWKAMENVWKHGDSSLKATEKRRKYLMLQPNCDIEKFFTEHLLAIVLRKTQIVMNKPVYLGLSVLILRKTITHKFWYDYVKSKDGEKASIVTWIQTASLST